ncbi:polyisoprenoid diphosphate/phosphate phosphohydrolase PLPP6-like [Lethenteron reissneri]|uniref:polyisoprenoid diphosphate/phosphate phosphohydrolase PLPP6-like n=1 Tax=Lethenteron reissneri TaxID=7753 RepID=UPI002AB6F66D|nr:polyisoprenoid diphosphate/phosphate phosphohydrolase PLPP6-like [Lethenteron reissneri]
MEPRSRATQRGFVSSLLFSVSHRPLGAEGTPESSLLGRLVAWDVALTSRLAVCAGVGSKWPSGRPLMKLIEVSGHGIPWLAGGLLCTYLGHSAVQRHWWINILFALLLDLVMVGTVKAVVRRPRPSHNCMDMFATVSVDQYSFPSGHATRAAMLAMLVFSGAGGGAGWIAGLGWWLVLAWALAVGLSRVMLGRHHVSDVACGLVQGWLQAWLVEVMWLSATTCQMLLQYAHWI